jgi:hypothetical protein
MGQQHYSTTTNPFHLPTKLFKPTSQIIKKNIFSSILSSKLKQKQIRQKKQRMKKGEEIRYIETKREKRSKKNRSYQLFTFVYLLRQRAS